jgi:hypothetical protein
VGEVGLPGRGPVVADGGLGDPVDEFADVRSEALLDLGGGGGGVFNDVVEQGCGQQVQLGFVGAVDQDVDDLQEVLDVGLAGGMSLAGVTFGGEGVDLAESVDDVGVEVAGEVLD